MHISRNRAIAGRVVKLRCRVRSGLLSAACLGFFCGAQAVAGTCQDPGADLTPQEYRNVKTACEQMDAAMAAWVNPEEGRRRLLAIQADDFKWWTPSGDPRVMVVRDRDAYIQLTTEYQHTHYIMPGSEVRIFATTAQDNRVATEMISDIAERRGGGIQGYTNRYHQLYVFNASGKIVEYHLYQDTAIHARDQIWTGQKVAENFVRALSVGGVMYMRTLLADDATWTTPRVGVTPSPSLDKEALLAALRKLQSRFDGFWVATSTDDITVDGNKIAVAAVSRGINPVTHGVYRNVHHFLLTLEGETSASSIGAADTIKSIIEYSSTPLLAVD
jgi:ketosteroid isomerase-like protein